MGKMEQQMLERKMEAKNTEKITTTENFILWKGQLYW